MTAVPAHATPNLTNRTEEPAMPFHVGQRVRTTVDLLAGVLGGFSAPAGTLGTIESLASPRCGYGVLLDGNPSGWPVVYDTFELAPA